MNLIANQYNQFLLALGFFSRLPVANRTQYCDADLNRANRYFALVGWLLAALVGGVYWLAGFYFDKSIAVFLAMAASLLLTGAFHEDGLADMADGFGGAFERQRKLEIMKDSRLGTYGCCALLAALGGKYLLLLDITEPVIALLVAYPLSRAVAASLLFDMHYVTAAQSKSKPMACGQTASELAFLLLSGSIGLVLLPVQTALFLAATLVAFRFGFKRWLNRQIGGYTGDCLGGAQQLSELLIYLVLAAK